MAGEGVHGVDHVPVMQGLWEGWVVGGGGGFAVAEHGGDDDAITGQGARGSEVEGLVDETAVAC